MTRPPRLHVTAAQPPTAFATGRAPHDLPIANPLAGGGVASWFSTHPPIAERVRRLREFRLAPNPATPRRRGASSSRTEEALS